MADVSLTGIAFTVKGSTDESAVRYFRDLTAALSSYKRVAKDLPSASMTKLVDTLQKFESLDTSNLEQLGKALKDMGSGLRSLSKASQEPFNLSEDTINSIQKLVDIANSIPDNVSAKMRDVAAGVKAMGQAQRMHTPQASPAVNNTPANITPIAIGFDETSDSASKASSMLDRFGAALDEDAEKAKAAKLRFDGFLASIKRIAMYRLIRTALKAITQGLQEGVNNAYQYSKALNGPFAKSMDMLATSSQYWRNSIGASLMPLINALAPQIDALVDRAVTLINVINKLFAILNGQSSYTKALKTGKEYAESASGSAKELQKTLMGFDEINRLNAPSSGGGSSGTDFSKMFKTEKLTGFMGGLAGEIQKHLESIQQVIFPTFALVLGTILTLTGHPAAGIPLMVLGASALVKNTVANWDGMTSDMAGALAAAYGIVGGFFFTIGVLTFLAGHPALGIGLMIAGAAGIVTAATVNWHASDNHVRDAAGTIAGIVGGVLLAIGTAAMMAGSVGLGLALMAAGAATSIAAVAVNWGYINNPFRSALSTLASIVSLSLMTLGAVVAFTGPGQIPLGLAMIAAGAIGFATANVNWDMLPAKFRSTLAIISLAVSMGFLAIGSILVLTGHLPLGLAMIALGAASFGMASVNWDAVPQQVRNKITTLMVILGGALLAVGAILFFTTLSPLGLGMMAIGGLSLASAMHLDWDAAPRAIETVIQKIKGKINGLKSWLGSFRLSFPSFKMPHFNVSMQTGWMGIKYPKIDVSYYAQGGFPDSGQLFFANEAGPELVGRMGNRNVVANNEQIVEGIKQGVMEAFNDSDFSGGNQDIVVNVDGDGLFRIVVKKNNQAVARTGYSPLKV